ncbi:hypothetical protein HYH02_006933 [Chlamydomonas schloesseri]|uniref:EF-hand domain-containing protein n=1 Tax=Chlamydomonas schloesseri TaxID=2026947 RepID=A0A835WJQ8_9CHLO|nr:hypothetical protein HYH02_006933 [Chlamydomonas schloesseri]|eukprot:KAG2448351.1 hypothetical protein HYH02_006933 [Chlamydomonas schloesseri]
MSSLSAQRSFRGSAEVNLQLREPVTATATGNKAARQGTVHLASLSAEAQEVLKKFDANGDGEVEAAELTAVVDELVKTQFSSRLFLYGLMAMTFALVMILGSGFGLTWAVVLSQKDTTVVSNTWVTRSDKVPIQLGNSQMTVVDGMLSSRGATNVTVSTTPSTVERPLNADMSAAQLTSLTRVYLRGSDGAQVGLRVTGFRVLAGSPPTLLLSTPSGSLVVSGNTVTGSATTTLMGDAAVVWQGVTGVFHK